MSTRIVCPNCHTAYNATDDQRGRRVRCKLCQAIFHAAGPGEVGSFACVDENGKGQGSTRGTVDPAQGGKREARATQNGGPRKQKSPRKISWLVLLLILGGVGGSLLIVTSSVLICLWLWTNPSDTWWASKRSDVRIPARDRNFGQVPDVRENRDGDGEGKAVPLHGADEQVHTTLPPPPRALDFASPLPQALDPPAPAKAPANAQLPPDLVQKVKRATVYLRVTLPDGGISQGSGFFGGEPNIVLTNAHVIGMLRPDSRQPQKIEVILNSGATEERKLEADLLGVDRHVDLAVLRVAAPDLPPPLPVRSAGNLHETQQVYVFGFPFGADLGKEITVSQSSVSSLRREENGILTKVQVNGGMHPGNSGGPVVDADGNVIGVAVSVLRFTQIHFAVPGEQVYAILQGCVARFALGQPYRKDNQVKVPATLEMIDPLRRIREPALEVWTGEPTPPSRLPSVTRPDGKVGDSPHEPQPLKYHDQVAMADILLPPLPSGKVYWVQPRWTNAAGETQWATANVYPLPPPVERKPVQLTFKHQTGSRGLGLNSWLDFKMAGPNGAEHTWAVNALTTVMETTEAVDAEELASVHLQYRTYHAKFSVDNQEVRRDDINHAKQTIKNLAANLRIDKQGNLVGNEIDLSRVPPDSQRVLATIHEELERALVSMAVPLPNKRVGPGESWKAERTILVPSADRSLAAHLDLTCTYLGKRERAGREEAVVDIQGQFRAPGGQAGLGLGRAAGVASVDLANGQVSQAEMVLDFDLEMNPASHLLPSHGKLTLRLQRDAPSTNTGD